MKSKEFLKEIRGLSVDELKVRAREISEELLKLRFRQSSGQLEQGHMLRILRNNLARTYTVIREKSQPEAGA